MDKQVYFIGCDHAAFKLKEHVKQYIATKYPNIQLTDLGCNDETSVDYPDYGEKVANEVAKDPSYKGIVLCGSGIGISIAANKVNGIRCALCHDSTTAKLARQHNDANMISMGARIIGNDVAEDMINAFINTEALTEERHKRRVLKFSEIEQKNK